MSMSCILLDFSKAFDRVNHGILIAKLKGYGISDHLLIWLQSYLTTRAASVRRDLLVLTPQFFPCCLAFHRGSNFGPFLFNLFLNDICDVIPTKCLMFADDIKILLEIPSPLTKAPFLYTPESIKPFCLQLYSPLNKTKNHQYKY